MRISGTEPSSVILKGWTRKWLGFFKHLLRMYNIGERSRKKINKIKTTFGPPLLPIKHPRKTPLTNLRGSIKDIVFILVEIYFCI